MTTSSEQRHREILAEEVSQNGCYTIGNLEEKTIMFTAAQTLKAMARAREEALQEAARVEPGGCDFDGIWSEYEQGVFDTQVAVRALINKEGE